MSRCKFDWAAVRRVWAREGLSARETAARFGAGYSTVTGRIRQEGWRRDAATGNEAGDRPAAGEAAAAPCAAACTDPAGEGTGPAAATIAAANAGGGAPGRAAPGRAAPDRAGAGASLPASAPGASDSTAPVSGLHAAVERVTAAVLAAMERREGEETDLRTAREMTAVLKELANLSRATEPAEPAAETADTVRVILAPELEEWGG
jgi:hypothetical protein